MARCQERLSELVPSQWGLVHLFDLCLWFGYIDTALALAVHGVMGCKLEDHNLGPLPDASDAEPSRPDSPWALYSHGGCNCGGWEICSRCCWGFPVDNGIWMNDWEADLRDAAEAAQEAAEMPLVNGILEIASRDEVLSLTMSDEASARLLDIAILCGNSKAAANLAKASAIRPLRRWRGHGLWWLDDHLQVFSAALLAGADFQDLHVPHRKPVNPLLDIPSVYPLREIPLLLLAALDFNSEYWQQLESFYRPKPRWSSSLWFSDLGYLFLSEKPGEGGPQHWPHPAPVPVSLNKVQNGLKSGWDLRYVETKLAEREIWTVREDGTFLCRQPHASLLDLAILSGNSGDADVLATAGVELGEGCLNQLWCACVGLRWGLSIDFNCYLASGSSASECKSAASVAARALLRRSLKHAGAEKGAAVYQLLTKKFQPKGVPLALVRHILAFSMEPPQILNQLDLWDEVRDWVPSLEAQNHGNGEASPVDLAEDLSELDVVEEPGPLGLC